MEREDTFFFNNIPVRKCFHINLMFWQPQNASNVVQLYQRGFLEVLSLLNCKKIKQASYKEKSHTQ